MTHIAADLALALDATRRAGELTLRWFGQRPAVHHKSPGQPVTEADLAADTLLRETLLAARPGYGWLSEETADDAARLTRGRVWVVDPIDGTRSFIAGLPEYAISVALAEDGRPVLGIVLNPARGEAYWGTREGGAWGAQGAAAPRPLALREDGDRPTLIASRSEILRGEIAPLLAILPGWQPEGQGSTALKMAHVAAGRGTAYVSRGPKSEWDVCAGALLVELAGGRATDAAGHEFRFNRPDTGRSGVIAAGYRWHATLVAAITGVAR